MLLSVNLQQLLTGEVKLAPCVVALGTFDGVHQGHVAILAAANKLAHELKAQPVVCTFDRLPLEVLDPERAPSCLTTHQRRLSLLEAILDKVVVLEFTTALASLSKQQFIDEVLVRSLGCMGAVAGFNYTFGKGALGTAADLRTLGERAGLRIVIVDPISNNSMPISSTRLRELVKAGEVERAADGLARPFSLEGTVVAGTKTGHALGFPTANLLCDSNLILPADGVYITYASDISENKPLGAALTAVSARPTFHGTKQTVESHILNYEGQLYGQRIAISFYQRLRNIVHFSTPAELKAQISLDIKAAHHYWLQRTAKEPFT